MGNIMRDVRSIKMARSRRNCAAVGDGGVFGIRFTSSILPAFEINQHKPLRGLHNLKPK